jgi:hypothetical protein
MDDPKGDISTLYQMASQSSASCYKLQVIKYGPEGTSSIHANAILTGSMARKSRDLEYIS